MDVVVNIGALFAEVVQVVYAFIILIEVQWRVKLFCEQNKVYNKRSRPRSCTNGVGYGVHTLIL